MLKYKNSTHSINTPPFSYLVGRKGGAKEYSQYFSTLSTCLKNFEKKLDTQVNIINEAHIRVYIEKQSVKLIKSAT